MDHSYLYSTRIEQTYDEDQDEILSFLRQEILKHSRLHVKLINYYKGLPVSYPAQIIGIERDTVDLEVYPHQAVIISELHYTFMRIKGLKHDIFAKAQYVNIRRHAASLNKLSYVEIMAEQRAYVRLELDNPLKAIFTTNEGIVRGQIREISFNGLGIEVTQPCSLSTSEETTVMFMLHDHTQNLNYNIKTQAKVVGINYDSNPKYYRFTIVTDKISDRQIAQFIIQRQIEIIHEIKDVTERVGEIPGSGSL